MARVLRETIKEGFRDNLKWRDGEKGKKREQYASVIKQAKVAREVLRQGARNNKQYLSYGSLDISVSCRFVLSNILGNALVVILKVWKQ
jgi:hypothetical protein